MTDPDAVWLFLYSDGTQQDKNSERTEIKVGLNDLTGLENIFAHGLPWMCCTAAQKKEITLLRFFKRTLGATDSLRHSFSSCYCTRLLQRSGQTHDEDIGGSRGAFHCECICC